MLFGLSFRNVASNLSCFSQVSLSKYPAHARSYLFFVHCMSLVLWLPNLVDTGVDGGHGGAEILHNKFICPSGSALMLFDWAGNHLLLVSQCNIFPFLYFPSWVFSIYFGGCYIAFNFFPLWLLYDYAANQIGWTKPEWPFPCGCTQNPV